jgi:hypothetical protein
MKTRIGLVACCGLKGEAPAPAGLLYLSPLFRKSRAWVERNCREWFILSAKYGLVHPDEVVAPYDQKLTRADGCAWAGRVAHQLDGRGLLGERFLALAGELYLAPLRGLVRFEAVLGRMEVGERLKWLTNQLRRPA